MGSQIDLGPVAVRENFVSYNKRRSDGVMPRRSSKLFPPPCPKIWPKLFRWGPKWRVPKEERKPLSPAHSKGTADLNLGVVSVREEDRLEYKFASNGPNAKGRPTGLGSRRVVGDSSQLTGLFVLTLCSNSSRRLRENEPRELLIGLSIALLTQEGASPSAEWWRGVESSELQLLLSDHRRTPNNFRNGQALGPEAATPRATTLAFSCSF